MIPRSTSSPGCLYGRGGVFAYISLLLVLVSLLVACGTTSNTNTTMRGGTLTVVPGPIGDYTHDFNVFANGSVLNGTQGLIYETLLFFNLEDESVKPWLASSYQFSSDPPAEQYTCLWRVIRDVSNTADAIVIGTLKQLWVPPKWYLGGQWCIIP